MKKLLLLPFLCVLIINIGVSAQTFTGVEHLGCPTDNSIRLNIVCNTAIDAYVKYGVSSGTYTDSTSAVSQIANEPIEFLIESLTSLRNLSWFRGLSGIYIR